MTAEEYGDWEPIGVYADYHAAAIAAASPLHSSPDIDLSVVSFEIDARGKAI